MKRILAKARDLARRLRRREDGNVLIMFGLAAIPLVIAVGMGIDIGRAYAVKVRLGTALDDAGLAVASTMDPNDRSQDAPQYVLLWQFRVEPAWCSRRGQHGE